MLERLPVVVGVGQCTNRIEDLAAGREPLALMTEAARIALDDCGANVAPHVDSVRVINVFSGAYGDPAGALAERLGLGGGERLYTAIGGNGPQWLVNRTADDLAAGRVRVALLAGAEAMYTLRLAAKRPVPPPWAQRAARPAVVGDARRGSPPHPGGYGPQKAGGGVPRLRAPPR